MSVRTVDHSPLPIVGYTDRLSVRPGESVTVHASSIHEVGSLRLVRLGHDGTNFTHEPVTAPQAIELAQREVLLGSYGVVDSVELPGPSLALNSGVWLSMLPAKDQQATLLAINGLAVGIDSAGVVIFSAGGTTLRSRTVLQLRRWYRVAAGVDQDGHAFLEVRPHRPNYSEPKSDRIVSESAILWAGGCAQLIIGRDLDGKLEDVRISQSIDRAEHDVLRLDFARGISTWNLYDHRGAVVGRLVGLPTRGVRGMHWNGSQKEWRHAPEQYAAIHFHGDDQGDQMWPVTATVEVPDDAQSGVYAVELAAGESVDYLPLFVRRGQGAPAPLILLMPTVTYLAYSLEHIADELLTAAAITLKHEELNAKFARANGYHSTYDTHADGSLVVFSSAHRPLMSMRPDHRNRAFCEHLLSADLHLLGWLARQGFDFDVATDHDLDAEGVGLLAPYRGVITGHHPEYITDHMYGAVESYLEIGGSLAYLGGNGFRHAAAIDPNDRSIVEVRRDRLNVWEGDVGEAHFQLTGDPGGYWMSRGRGEWALLGAGWAGTGLEDGEPFRRTAASFDPRVAHIFEGLGDELIGEVGAFLGAAASIEVDFANPLLGTPAHALVIATTRMSETYAASVVPMPILKALGSEDKVSRRRADMTYYECSRGGAVFSASSMGWIGALSHDCDRNAVSRITANVLRRFIAADGNAKGRPRS